MNKKWQIYLPLILSVVFIVGIFVGSRLSSGHQNGQVLLKISDLGFNKMNEIINYIEQEYVDTVDKKQLIDKTINSLLQELDPHSTYIAASDLASVNEPLEGNFEGIGVEFSIQRDTILVVSPVTGGPSEQAGIKAGDRMIEVDGINIAGIGITDKKIKTLLRGPRGTKIKLGIIRRGKPKEDFIVTRGQIPINSLDAAYLINDTTGYIKLSRFSKTTHQEFLDAALKLQRQGMKKVILDLRNNGGGYLDEAVKLADEFLEKGKIIVFTEGKARPKRYYKASSEGHFEDTHLDILIDEGSASASEIISGAIQDNDRGTIIGRRSYGKGLVQEQSSWPDGSAIRLTIARYYTPTGRSIQTPYNHGSKNYHLEQYHRFGKLEMEIDSSLFPDSLKYLTEGGHIVYGGGGIYPDIFVPFDTLNKTNYLMDIYYSGMVREFALEYVDQERENLNKNYANFYAFNKNFQVTPKILEQLIAYASKREVKRNDKEINKSKDLIKRYLKANISRYLFGNNGFYSTFNEQDVVVKKALETKHKNVLKKDH